jgi:hypothetical protein
VSGAWIDDTFSGHRKRRLVSLAADGLLARALSECCKPEGGTDGFVDEQWVELQMPRRQRTKLLAEMTHERLFEALPADTTRELVGHAKKGLRTSDIHVTVGPFRTAGFLVHDFLDFNRSVAERTARRRRDAQKKRNQRSTPTLWNGKPEQLSPGTSQGTPPPPQDSGVGGGSSTESTNGENGHGYSRAPAPGLVGQVMDVLRRCARLSVPDHCDVAIESAIAGNPGKDFLAAAHAAVVRATDPAWRTTWGPSVFAGELRRQQAGAPAGTSRRQSPSDLLRALDGEAS